MTFQEIFFTLVVIWIIFRIFRSGKSHHHSPKPKESETTIKTEGTSKKKDLKVGEYVDFEEVKD